MLEEFQPLERAEFFAFWNDACRGHLARRAWRLHLIASLVAVSIMAVLWRLDTGWLLMELTGAAWLLALCWIRDRDLTPEEKRFLKCPSCDCHFKPSHIERIKVASRCPLCGADILS